MKRLTKYAKADLKMLEEAVNRMPDAIFTENNAGELHAAVARLIADIGIDCETEHTLIGKSTAELTTLLSACFHSQFENVSMIRKSDLCPDMLRYLSTRVASHSTDPGPTLCWDHVGAQDKLHVAMNEKNLPIGITHMIGGQSVPAVVGWWIDPLYRGERYTYPILDLCAELLKGRETSEVGYIQIDDDVYQRSEKLRSYFCLHFPPTQH